MSRFDLLSAGIAREIASSFGAPARIRLGSGLFVDMAQAGMGTCGATVEDINQFTTFMAAYLVQRLSEDEAAAGACLPVAVEHVLDTSLPERAFVVDWESLDDVKARHKCELAEAKSRVALANAESEDE